MLHKKGVDEKVVVQSKSRSEAPEGLSRSSHGQFGSLLAVAAYRLIDFISFQPRPRPVLYNAF